MTIRENMVGLAQSFNGTSVSFSRGRYVDLLGPEETKAMQDYFCDPKTSGCALAIRGLLRKLGCKDKRVLPPYKFGTAISLLVGIARDRGAWRAAKVGNLPIAGDFVLVGGDKARDGGVEHVFTVCSVDLDDKGILITSIDGGQRDPKGQQAILAKNRRWVERDGAYWDVSSAGNDPGSNAPGGRRVQGWGDIEKVFEGNE